jgi:hypothetical protein
MTMQHYAITHRDGTVAYGPWAQADRLATQGRLMAVLAVDDLTGRHFQWAEHGSQPFGSALCVQDNGDHLIWEDDDEQGSGPNGGRLFSLVRRAGLDVYPV